MKDVVAVRVASFGACVGLGDVAGLGPGRRGSAWSLGEVEARVAAWLREEGVGGERGGLLRGVALFWHDHLLEAHEAAQEVAGPDGSFLHAQMHRREGDYWNSKYWWKRVGVHPCFRPLAGRVLELLAGRNDPELAGRLLPGGRWSPEAFVDACEGVAGEAESGALVGVLREIQRLEVEAFVAHLVAGCGAKG